MELRYESFEKLEELMIKTFTKIGMPEQEAKITAQVLIESDKRGIDSHGVGRFKPIYLDRIEEGIMNPITKIDVIKDDRAIAVLDANHGMGHVVSHKAMSMAIEKAKNHGLGMVVVRNSTHYGIAGYYASMAAKENMIGITGTNARPSIAPTFGVQNMLGTNPLTFGMPTDEAFDFVYDGATSITQRGKIEHYARINKTMPVGWVIDAQGEPVTDANVALKGFGTGECALAPLGGIGEELGGYKGYGYATVVEILSAALQSGAFLSQLSGVSKEGNVQPHKLGHFFIAIDVAPFIEVEEFKKITGDILRELRASHKAKGQDRIYTAGEKEYLAYLERKEKGVPLNENVLNSLYSAREKYQVDFTFTWEE
ncbi:MAG: Ldh family oxidoreductase [Clostridiales bacterium]|nr:Ldh family oxidoreductase [Clostridiales bacterium]